MFRSTTPKPIPAAFSIQRSSFIDWCILATVSLTVLTWAGPMRADWKDDIGFTKLQAEQGGSLATGAGVNVSMVEATVSGNYKVDTTSAEFSGKTITHTGPTSSNSGHAAGVANHFYGNSSSIAPGVTNVSVIEAIHNLSNVLNAVTTANPLVPTYKVQNHSYVVTYGGSDPLGAATVVNLRQDYVIDTYDVTNVVALNNGVGALPHGMAQGMNSIAVGLTNGNHSYGQTTLPNYFPGRTKPDIVAPSGVTSNATPMVSSAAAMLHEIAGNSNAARSETMRAILMAGATKDEFPSWDRTTQRPLDEVFGAGELNVYNSFHILNGGEFDGSVAQPVTNVGSKGYDYNPQINANEKVFYNFEVGAGGAQDLSLLLAWNFEVKDNTNDGTFNPDTSLANMSLELYDSSSTFLGTLLDSSLSPSDNVEHIYMENLGQGAYTIAVNSDSAGDYGLAWRVTAVPEPGAVALLSLLSCFVAVVAWRRRKQRARLSQQSEA